jgi:hypothetical protein
MAEQSYISKKVTYYLFDIVYETEQHPPPRPKNKCPEKNLGVKTKGTKLFVV